MISSVQPAEASAGQCHRKFGASSLALLHEVVVTVRRRVELLENGIGTCIEIVDACGDEIRRSELLRRPL